jgi:hypothetical protein
MQHMGGVVRTTTYPVAIEVGAHTLLHVRRLRARGWASVLAPQTVALPQLGHVRAAYSTIRCSGERVSVGVQHRYEDQLLSQHPPPPRRQLMGQSAVCRVIKVMRTWTVCSAVAAGS